MIRQRLVYPALFSLLGLASFSSASLTADELTTKIASLKGDDIRLFKWDASSHTAQRQVAGDCASLVDAAKILVDQSSEALSALAAEYATLCITNNPLNRATFSQVEDIHASIVNLLGHQDPRTSYLAAHLIYISTYTNEKNHQTFFQKGAVPALGKLVMKKDALPIQKMWAAAALSNMAASYCDTKDDGTCWWEWTESDEHVQLGPESPLYSDGSAVRKAMLAVDGLVQALIELACLDIEQDEDVEEEIDEIMPGYNAIVNEHENREEIVKWAAMSALKNLALEPTAKPLLDEKAMFCACYLKESDDWLEESKSWNFLHTMRREEDPCLFREDGLGLCINQQFIDSEFLHCDEYEEATDEDCTNTDIFTQAPAGKTCCYCGGGAVFVEQEEHDEL